MRQILGFAGVLLVGIVSCTYAPEEVYFKEVAQIYPVGNISLNDYNDQDTIFIYQATDFSFDITIDKGAIENFEVKIDNHWPLSVSQSKFSIANDDLKTGTYQLSIQFTSPGATGSLADKEGVERVQIWRKWVLVIDVDEPPMPVIKFTEENGYLKLSWTPFLKPNFASYQLYTKNQVPIIFTDPLQTSWIDSAYVGGYGCSYSVITNSVYKRSKPGSAGIFIPQSFEVSYTQSDSTVHLSWSKPHYKNAFKEYYIKEYFNTQPIVIQNIQDTTLSFKLSNAVYGRDTRIHFSISPTKPGYTPFSSEKEIRNLVKLKNLPINLWKYSVGLNRIVSRKSGWISFYNHALQPTDSVKTGPYFTANLPSQGNFLYDIETKKITQLNLVTKERKELLLDTIPADRSGPHYVNGASNQLVSFCYERLNKLQGKVFHYDYIYDFSLNKVTYYDAYVYFKNMGETIDPDLSDDGRFAILGDALYAVTNGSLQPIGRLPTEGYFIDFRSDDNGEFFFNTTNTIDIYNTIDLTLKKSIPRPKNIFTQFQSYDPVTKNILFSEFQGEDNYMINIETDEMRIIKANTNSNDYILMDGYFFNQQNYDYLKVF